jgi:hypothetical protein
MEHFEIIPSSSSMRTLMRLHGAAGEFRSERGCGRSWCRSRARIPKMMRATVTHPIGL